MKELENFLQNIADGLRSLADVVETLAEKTEHYQHFGGFEKANEASGEYVKAKSRNGGKRRKIVRIEKPKDASETVFHVIQSRKEGVETSDLIKATQFEEKKVRNIIYKLKKQNRIKASRRGVYVAA